MLAITTPVGFPKKRRRLSESSPTREDVEGANQRTVAAVAAFLGRRVRVFLNPRLWGNSGGGPAAPLMTGTPTVVIRVIFPDGYVMEARFGRCETVQQLVDLARRAVRRPDLPFYLYTAPPKQRIVDMGVDFRSAGLVPGANVYFCWELPPDAEGARLGPCLRDEVRLLQWLDLNMGNV
ncbi:hypothetical protein Taro_053935 [Colocasia esculenta]|uniref:UBX domain-containing protein n=1 Tax=Colocasia esculenta TaxID=4460 RepID=A0A843XPK4_COLES|nr:hypothetical protein [Colocasia esculenta]